MLIRYQRTDKPELIAMFTGSLAPLDDASGNLGQSRLHLSAPRCDTEDCLQVVRRGGTNIRG